MQRRRGLPRRGRRAPTSAQAGPSADDRADQLCGGVVEKLDVGLAVAGGSVAGAERRHQGPVLGRSVESLRLDTALEQSDTQGQKASAGVAAGPACADAAAGAVRAARVAPEEGRRLLRGGGVVTVQLPVLLMGPDSGGQHRAGRGQLSYGHGAGGWMGAGPQRSMPPSAYVRDR